MIAASFCRRDGRAVLNFEFLILNFELAFWFPVIRFGRAKALGYIEIGIAIGIEIESCWPGADCLSI